MRIKITAGGIYDGEGKEIPIGTEVTVKAKPEGWAGRYEVLGEEGGKAAVTNPKKGSKKPEADDVPGYKAEERDGSWVIVDGDGAVIGKPLTADDAKAFNDMKDEDKAEFAAAHAKA